MFCVKCGKQAEAGNFCTKCFLERESLFEIKDFDIKVCDICHKVERYNDMKSAVMARMKSPNSISDCSLTERRIGNKIHLVVTCTGKMPPLKQDVSQSRKVLVIARRKKCENCIKLSGGYYEAALQVRGDQQERILKIIRNHVTDEMLTDIIKLKEGYDVRIVDKRVANRIAQELMDNFSVKKTFKLIAEKKGKKLYRNFYAIR